MTVKFKETRIITQVEYVYYVFDFPEEVEKLSEEEQKQWIYDNYDEMDFFPEYEAGEIIDVQWEDSEFEIVK